MLCAATAATAAATLFADRAEWEGRWPWTASHEDEAGTGTVAVVVGPDPDGTVVGMVAGLVVPAAVLSAPDPRSTKTTTRGQTTTTR